MPYTYHIYHKPTKMHYYGARWKPGCTPDDLWITYFTSCKRVHKLIEEYGTQSFEVRVRKTFSSKKECLDWEQKVLKRLKVKTNPKWINIAIGKPTMLGKKHSEETKNKMRKPKGPWSEERKAAWSLHMKEMCASGKVKIPTTLGYKHTPETLEKFKQRSAKSSCAFQT